MEVVEQVRQAASIVEVASQYTTLKRRGSKHVGLCPFHSEKTPSFTVDEDKQLYHCFGCNAGGDVFTLVMEKEQLSFPEALKYLADKYHIPLPKKPGFSPQAQKLEEQVLEIHERALAFFRRNLTGTPEGAQALAYLRTRGLSDDTIRTFQLGYAPKGWDGLTNHFKAWKTPPALLEKAGLAIPGKKAGEYYDRFRGRTIFPIFNASGKPVAFGGRALFDQEPKYLNSPDTPIYTKGKLLYGLNFSRDALREAGEAVLVEGYTDYIALYQAGLTNVVASLGTALTLSQLGLIERFAGKVAISYDGDAAGQQAALRAVSLCFEKGLPSRVLVLPDGLDPDGAMRKYGPVRYRELLDRAIPGFRFFVAALTRGKTMGIPEEKARVVKQVFQEIARVPDPVAQSEYTSQAAELLGVDEKILRTLALATPADVKAEDKSPFYQAEKRLAQILVRNRPIARYVFAEMKDADIKDLASEPLLRLIRRAQEDARDRTYAELRRELEPGLAGALDRILLEEGPPPTVEEALDCLHTLRDLSLIGKKRRIKAEIKNRETRGDKDLPRDLFSQTTEISQEQIDLLTRKTPE